MSPKIAMLLCASLCTVMSVFSQEKSNEKIDVNTDIDVTEVYEQVVIEGYGTAFIYKELATAHYFKSNYTQAKRWFEALFAIEAPIDADLKFRYVQTLKALDLYDGKGVVYSISSN